MIYSDIKNQTNTKTKQNQQKKQPPPNHADTWIIEKCVGIFFEVVGEVKNHCVSLTVNWILHHSCDKDWVWSKFDINIWCIVYIHPFLIITLYLLQIEINPSSKFSQFLPLPAPLYSV